MQIHIVLILNNDSHAIYLLGLAICWLCIGLFVCSLSSVYVGNVLHVMKASKSSLINYISSFSKKKKKKKKTLYMLENLESG